MIIFHLLLALLVISHSHAADSSSSSGQPPSRKELRSKLVSFYETMNGPEGFKFPAGKYETTLLHKGDGRVVFLYTINKGLQNERQMVVKAFSETKDSADTWLQEAWLEVCLLRVVDHPNIMAYIGGYFAKGKVCLWSEYFPKGTLADHVTGKSKAGTLTVEHFKNVFRDVAKALMYLHSYGMIHRDIKPANIALHGDGAKVIDLGMCTPPTAKKNLLHSTRAGTRYYMAPEVYFRQPYNHLVDIWSFGITVWTMFGEPFPGAQNVEKRFETLKTKESVWGVWEEIPEVFRMVVRSAVEYDPVQRPNAFSILDLLENPFDY